MPLPSPFPAARCPTILGCLWLAPAGVAQPSRPAYSLPDCIGYATENSFTLQSARLDETIASHYVREVRSAGLPQITVGSALEDNIRLPVSLIPAEVTGGEPGTFTAVRFGTKYNLRNTLRADQLLYDGAFWVGLKAARQIGASPARCVTTGRTVRWQRVDGFWYFQVNAEGLMSVFCLLACIC